MSTRDAIFQAIKEVPESKLEELHSYIKTLISHPSEATKENILAKWQTEMIEDGLREFDEGMTVSHEDFLKSYNR